MMGKLKRGLSKVSVVLLLGAAATACASAAIHKHEFGKFEVHAPSLDDGIVEGGIFQVSVTSKDPIREVSGRFQGRNIDFYPDTDPSASGISRYSAVVGVDYGTPPGKLELAIKAAAGEKSLDQNVPILIRSGTFPSETLRVPPRTVRPSAKDKRQIARDRAVLARAYAAKTTKKYWDPPGVLPIKSDITSVFGTSRVYNGVKQNVHLGTDLRAPTGTTIVAPYAGRVAVARFLFYTGYTVILDHGYGLFTIYGHMSRMGVKEGQEIAKGASLGLSGATGRVSGPHLHWGVNLHGTKVDPITLVQTLK